MVRETRYLLVGNLPDKVTEEVISEQFQRYGKIQSVKFHDKKDGEEGSSATVAFADIKSASKAHNGEVTIEGKVLVTEYSEGSATGSAVTRTRVNPAARPVPPAFRQGNAYPNRTKGSEEEESYDSRDFHYGASRGSGDQAGFENRYQGNYSENGPNQRGRPRERFFNRGGYKGVVGQRQFGQRHHAEGTRPYDQLGGDRDFERPKNPPSPAHSASQSSGRHSGGRKKGSRSNSGSRSRSNSSSSSSCSRSSSASSDSRSGSRSSHSSCPSSVRRHRISSTATIPQVKPHRTESQDSTSSEKTGDVDHTDKRPHGICITALPLRSSDTSLRDGLFHEYKKYGKVNAVQVAGQTESRYAIVSFKKPEDAEKAFEASQEKRFFGAAIKVAMHEGIADTEDNEFRPPEAELDEYHPKATRTLFVGNLEKDITNQELRDRFSEYGEIIDIDVKRQGAVSAYAFVQYFDITSVVKCLKELEGQSIGSMKIKLGFGKSMPTNCIWLDNIAESVSENFLCRQFSRYGNVSHGIIDKQSNKGLVYFTNMDAAQFALNEMRNRILNGKKIITDFASRDCQNRFFEKMEKSGQLQPGQRPDERRGWTTRQPGQQEGGQQQWESSGRSRTNFRQFNNRGLNRFRGTRNASFRGRGQNFKEGFSGEEFRRQRSYDEFSQGSNTPYPEGEDSFEQDLRAYSHSQRERREADGSTSPSQFSDEMYPENYRRTSKDSRYSERYGYHGESPEGEHGYTDDSRYEYGKGRGDEKYYSSERYMSGRDKDQSPPPGEYGRSYSPEGQNWSASPSYNRQHKDNYGRHTPPTPLGDENQDFSSRDHSPMDTEGHHMFGDYKTKSGKPDDFDITEADIEEIRYQHKKETVRSERLLKKRTYDDSFGREHPQYDETNRKFDRIGGRSNAEFKRDLLKNVQRIQSEISDKKSRMHKENSSPNSSSSTDSEHGSLTEGELSKLQHEKLLLLEKLKMLEKEGSTSDNESNELEDTRKVVSKRQRLDAWTGKSQRLHSELGSVIVGPRKSQIHSEVYDPYKPDVSQSYRKQMEAYRKSEDHKDDLIPPYKDAKNVCKTVMSYDSEGEEILPSILSPKETSSSFKKRKKYDNMDDKNPRSYRSKKGDEDDHPSSDNEDSRNFNRTDSIASLRRLSSGHSSPRTPVTTQSGDHHRYSESDLSVNEGLASGTPRKRDSGRKSSETDNHDGQSRRSRYKDDHQPIIIPLGDDSIVPNLDLKDPRQEKPISDELMSLPLPKFASFTPPLLPIHPHQDSPTQNDSPCFSPPSSGSKNQSPEMSPSDSNSQESLGLPKPPEGYIPPGEEEDNIAVTGEEGTEEGEEVVQEKKQKDSDDLSDSSEFNDSGEVIDQGDNISLEERIRRLDEKLNRPAPAPSTKISNDQLSPLNLTSALPVTSNATNPTAIYSKYKIRKKQDAAGSGSSDNKSEPSEIMRAVLSRSSIFDQDSKRLEQINEKYCPKSVSVSVDENPKSVTIRTKAAAKEMPLSTLPQSLAGRLGPSSSSFPTLSINTSLANQSSSQNTYLSPSSDSSPVSPFPAGGFLSQDHIGIADSNSTASTDNYCDIPSLTNVTNEQAFSNKSMDSVGDGLTTGKDSLSEFPKLSSLESPLLTNASLDCNNSIGPPDNFTSQMPLSSSQDNLDIDIKAGQDHSNFMENMCQPQELNSNYNDLSAKVVSGGSSNSATDLTTSVKGVSVTNSVSNTSLSDSKSVKELDSKEKSTDVKVINSSTSVKDNHNDNSVNILGKRKGNESENEKEVTDEVKAESNKINACNVENIETKKEDSSSDSPDAKKPRLSEEESSNTSQKTNKNESLEKKEKEKKDKNKEKKRDKVDGDSGHKDKTDKKDKDKDGKDKDKTGSSKSKGSSSSAKVKDSGSTDTKPKDGTSAVKKDKNSDSSSHKHKSSKSKDKVGKDGHTKKNHSSEKKDKTAAKSEGDANKTVENDVDKSQQDKSKSKDGHSGHGSSKDNVISKEGQTDKANSHLSKKKEGSTSSHSNKLVKDPVTAKPKEESENKDITSSDASNHKVQDGKESPEKSSMNDSSKHKPDKTDTMKHKSENKHKTGDSHKHKSTVSSESVKHKEKTDNTKHKEKSSSSTDNTKHKEKSSDSSKHKDKSAEVKHKDNKSSAGTDTTKHKTSKSVVKDGDANKHKDKPKDGEHAKHKDNSSGKDTEQSKSVEKSSSIDSESSVKHKDKGKTSNHDKSKHKQENKHLEKSSSKDKAEKPAKEKSSSSGKPHKVEGKSNSHSDVKMEKQKSSEHQTNKSKTDNSEGNKEERKTETESNKEGKSSENVEDKSKDKTSESTESKNEKHHNADKGSHKIKKNKTESEHHNFESKKEEKKKVNESLKSAKTTSTKKNKEKSSVTKPDIESNKPQAKEKTKKNKKEVAKSKEVCDSKGESSKKEKEKEKKKEETATTPKNDVDDFDWAAWAEPYESMYDKVKRRSNEKGKQHEMEKELKKGLGKLKSSRKKRSKFSDIEDTGESSLSSDDSDDPKPKPKKSTVSKETTRKKKGILNITSSSDNDDDDEDDSQAFLKSFQKPVNKPTKEVKGFLPGKKASILDIYSSDSEEDELSSDSFKKIVKKKESTAESSEDCFDTKHKMPKVKKATKKDKPQSAKKVLKKQKSVVDTDDDMDSDINFISKQKSQQKSKISKPKSKTDEKKTPQKVVRKIFSSSSDSETNDEVVPEIVTNKKKQKDTSEKLKGKKDAKRTPLSILQSDSDDVDAPTQSPSPKPGFMTMVTAQTISECDIEELDYDKKKENKEKSTKKGRKKENILVSEGKLEIGKPADKLDMEKHFDKKDAQKIGLFEKIKTFFAHKSEIDTPPHTLNDTILKKEKQVKNNDITNTDSEKAKSSKANKKLGDKTDNLFDKIQEDKSHKKSKKESKKNKKQKEKDAESHKKEDLTVQTNVQKSSDAPVDSNDGYSSFKSPVYKKDKTEEQPKEDIKENKKDNVLFNHENVLDKKLEDNKEDSDNGQIHFSETEIAAECSISDEQDAAQDVLSTGCDLIISEEINPQVDIPITQGEEVTKTHKPVLEGTMPESLQGEEPHGKKKGKKKKKDKKEGESKKSKKKEKDGQSDSSCHKKEKKKKSDNSKKTDIMADDTIGLAGLAGFDNDDITKEQTNKEAAADETHKATEVLASMFGNDISLSSPPYQSAPLLDAFSQEETTKISNEEIPSNETSNSIDNFHPPSHTTCKASTPARLSQDDMHPFSFMSPTHMSTCSREDVTIDTFSSTSNKKSASSSSHDESHTADIFDFTEDDDSDIQTSLRKRMATSGERRKSSSLSLSCSDTELPHSKDTPRKSKNASKDDKHKDNETPTPTKAERKSKKKNKEIDMPILSPSKEETLGKDKQKDVGKSWLDIHTEKTDSNKMPGIGLGVKETPSFLETNHDDDKLLTFDEPLFGFYKSTYDFPPKSADRSQEEKSGKGILSPPLSVFDSTEKPKKNRKKRKSKSNSSSESKDEPKVPSENPLTIDTQSSKPEEPLLSPITTNKKTEEEVLENIKEFAEKLHKARKTDDKPTVDEESNRLQVTEEAVSSLEHWNVTKPIEMLPELREDTAKPVENTEETPVEQEPDQINEQAEDETALAIRSILPLDEKTGEFVLPHSRGPSLTSPTVTEDTSLVPPAESSVIGPLNMTPPVAPQPESTTEQMFTPPRPEELQSETFNEPEQQPEKFSPQLPVFSSPAHTSVITAPSYATPPAAVTTNDASLLVDTTPQEDPNKQILPTLTGKKGKGTKTRKPRITKAEKAALALAQAQKAAAAAAAAVLAPVATAASDNIMSPEAKTGMMSPTGNRNLQISNPLEEPVEHIFSENRPRVLNLPLGRASLGQSYNQFEPVQGKETFATFSDNVALQQTNVETEPPKEEKRVTRRSKKAKEKQDPQVEKRTSIVEDTSLSQGDSSFNSSSSLQMNCLDDMSEFGSQELSDVDKDDYDQNRLVMDESGYPPTNDKTHRTTRRARKTTKMNYKEMNSGVSPRTNSPRSRTSPRSPRNVASPKQSTSPKLQNSPKPSEIPSAIVKIERLPLASKNYKKDNEIIGDVSGKDVNKKITRSSLVNSQRVDTDPKELDIPEYTIEPSQDTNKGPTNIFDFDASESELKVEPMTVKRQNRRRKRTTDNTESTDKEMHVIEKEHRPEEARVRSLSTESGIKMVIGTPRGKTPRVTKHNARPELENVELHKPRHEPEAKVSKSPEIQAPVPVTTVAVTTVESCITSISKPVATVAVEQKQPVPELPTVTTTVEVTPVTLPEVPKIPNVHINKKAEKTTEPVAVSKPSDMTSSPVTPMTPMSNIDRIIDNVSKGIFDWTDLDDNKATPTVPAAPVHDHGVHKHKKMSAIRSHSAENALHGNAVNKMVPNKGFPSVITGINKPTSSLPSNIQESQGVIDAFRMREFSKEHHGVLASTVTGITISTTTVSDSLATTKSTLHSPRFYTEPNSKSRPADVSVTYSSTSQMVNHHMSQAPANHGKDEEKHDLSKGHLQQVPPYHLAGAHVNPHQQGLPRQQMAPHESVTPQGNRFQPSTSEHVNKHSRVVNAVSDILTQAADKTPITSTAPTCVVHPITTTAFPTKHDGIIGMQTSVTTTTSAMTGIPIATSMSQQDMIKQDLVKEQIRAAAIMSGQQFHPPDLMPHKQDPKSGRNSTSKQNAPHQGQEGHPQRPPSAHSQHPQKTDQVPPRPSSAHEKVPQQHPPSIQEQMRLHQFQKGFYQVPQHLIPYVQQAQAQVEAEKKRGLNSPVDLQKVSASSIVQKGAVIAASAGVSQGPSPHPQIRSPALAQTAPSPHQITQRSTSPSLHKKVVDKTARWSELGPVDGRGGVERMRLPGDLLTRDGWIYGAPGLIASHQQQEQGMNLTKVQQPSPVPRESRDTPSSRVQHPMGVGRQAEANRHQAELEYQQLQQHEQELRQKQDWKRQHPKQQELQRQEIMRQQLLQQQHQQQLIHPRESSNSSNPTTSESRQTAHIQGHPRNTAPTSNPKAIDAVRAQPGLQYHGADMHRPGSQGIAGAEISQGIPGAAHIYSAAELQSFGMLRMLDHHPLYSQQHGGPHYIPSHLHYMQHSRMQPDTRSPTGHIPPQSALDSPPGRPHSQSGSKHGEGISNIPSRPLPDPSTGGEGSLLSLLQRYPVMWQGVLALKNDSSVVQMHLISGFQQLVKLSLPQQAQDGTVQPLRIAQRMRLEPTQLDGVVKRMQFEKDFCMLLALPCGRDHGDIINQTRAMSSGFIQYLQQKQAAGIVNVADPGSQQPAYVVHIFPPCEFSHTTLGRVGFDLMHQVRDLSHLLVIITTVA